MTLSVADAIARYIASHFSSTDPEEPLLDESH